MPSRRVAAELNAGTYYLTLTVQRWYYLFDPKRDGVCNPVPNVHAAVIFMPCERETILMQLLIPLPHNPIR